MLLRFFFIAQYIYTSIRKIKIRITKYRNNYVKLYCKNMTLKISPEFISQAKELIPTISWYCSSGFIGGWQLTK